MPDDIFAPQFKATPYWWDVEGESDRKNRSPPNIADVVIIGSGFTGMSAALTLARAGRQVVVLEAERPGFGCSTRNGGHIGPGIRNTFTELSSALGKDTAYSVKREGYEAYKYLLDLIANEDIKCELSRNGHCIGAHTPRSVHRLRKLADTEPPEFETCRLVDRKGALEEIGSKAFHGALIYSSRGGLHPKLYHMELMKCAEKAGAQVYAHHPVSNLSGSPGHFTVTTANGQINTRDVILATNGYTGSTTPWWQRRIIPIGSYMIATEPLDPNLVRTLFPKGYQMNDTRKVIYYYRPSPDGRRILFGGRVALTETDPRTSAPSLHAAMVKVFPELSKARISHSWMGFIAYTFDSLPHFGVHEGIHYAMGYCGNGVSMSTYLGSKVANLLLQRATTPSVFQSRAFRTMPFYTGKPWFLAPAVGYYRLKDNLLG